MWELKPRPQSKQTSTPPTPEPLSALDKPAAPPEPRKDGKPQQPYEAPSGSYWRWNTKTAAYMDKAELLEAAKFFCVIAEAHALDPATLIQSYKTLRAYRR